MWFVCFACGQPKNFAILTFTNFTVSQMALDSQKKRNKSLEKITNNTVTTKALETILCYQKLSDTEVNYS